MRVLVASTFVPFVRGGDARIVEDLCHELTERGHEVDTILLPFSSDPRAMTEQLLALRLLDVSEAGDILIAIRTPSYLLRHPRKVVWFIHHHRPAYDLWGTPHQDIPDSPEGLSLREPIARADDLGLHSAVRVFANSRVTARRLRKFNRIGAEVLYPPLGNPEGFRAGGYGDYVFAPSRITPIKRQRLLVEAMTHVQSDVRLVLAGAPDAPEHLRDLEQAIDELGVASRIDLRGSWIGEQEKLELYAEALAVGYVPYDEDSYGYVSLEAYAAQRAVVTCTDSGGTLELVEDGRTGLVVDPSPERLAEAFDRLHDDRELPRRFGEAGHERVRELGISWDRVMDKLLA